MKKVQLLPLFETRGIKEELLVLKERIFSASGSKEVRQAEKEYVNLLMCIKA